MPKYVCVYGIHNIADAMPFTEVQLSIPDLTAVIKQ